MHAHHTYSVKKYPHLANRGEIIFPTTFQEHLHDVENHKESTKKA